ncbi:thioredoxin family protein [Rhizosphaericola mali]|uniref:Thioredoxin family protein n=1 Tax=Rhizosphaericola mali TaxID=2545455 RepID=A0A5P2G684_9BACT|nr:thioredoxin family protein [Rhizosphaericola mali]QES89270.1 thioredoxin family protein [Rhizosphaericola mali]
MRRLFFLILFCTAITNVFAEKKYAINTDTTLFAWQNLAHQEEEFTMEDLDTLVQNHSRVLVEFGANWCMPCLQMKPRMHKVVKEYQDKLYIKNINVDHAETLTKSLNIQMIPVLLLFENGKLLRVLPGLQSMKNIREFLK